MNILIVDNYDSFTYNLVQIIRDIAREREDIRFEVLRNDKFNIDECAKFDKFILSPGPGIPSEAGLLNPLIAKFAATKSILGVCLGHQAIGEVSGGSLINLTKVYHGVASEVHRVKTHHILDGLPEKFMAGRYHSWTVDPTTLPEVLEVTAVDTGQCIMAMRHKFYDLHGVQFHPESVLTPLGATIIAKFLSS